MDPLDPNHVDAKPRYRLYSPVRRVTFSRRSEVIPDNERCGAAPAHQPERNQRHENGDAQRGHEHDEEVPGDAHRHRKRDVELPVRDLALACAGGCAVTEGERAGDEGHAGALRTGKRHLLLVDPSRALGQVQEEEFRFGQQNQLVLLGDARSEIRRGWRLGHLRRRSPVHVQVARVHRQAELQLNPIVLERPPIERHVAVVDDRRRARLGVFDVDEGRHEPIHVRHPRFRVVALGHRRRRQGLQFVLGRQALVQAVHLVVVQVHAALQHVHHLHVDALRETQPPLERQHLHRERQGQRAVLPLPLQVLVPKGAPDRTHADERVDLAQNGRAAARERRVGCEKIEGRDRRVLCAVEGQAEGELGRVLTAKVGEGSYEVSQTDVARLVFQERVNCPPLLARRRAQCPLAEVVHGVGEAEGQLGYFGHIQVAPHGRVRCDTLVYVHDIRQRLGSFLRRLGVRDPVYSQEVLEEAVAIHHQGGIGDLGRKRRLAGLFLPQKRSAVGVQRLGAALGPLLEHVYILDGDSSRQLRQAAEAAVVEHLERAGGLLRALGAAHLAGHEQGGQREAPGLHGAPGICPIAFMLRRCT
ncbi:uncharacterized protein BcabD6B2_29880 [Babesia caballi]|uniref:Uncharacterized protein n=1 Tax=Babesia caballi TaxID=5871 RepID=A0AAV4LTR1_BABCB|nr:hypothetical protein BcabD6B2_29880 [Babesia caballi]